MGTGDDAWDAGLVWGFGGGGCGGVAGRVEFSEGEACGGVLAGEDFAGTCWRWFWGFQGSGFGPGGPGFGVPVVDIAVVMISVCGDSFSVCDTAG